MTIKRVSASELKQGDIVWDIDPKYKSSTRFKVKNIDTKTDTIIFKAAGVKIDPCYDYEDDGSIEFTISESNMWYREEVDASQEEQ